MKNLLTLTLLILALATSAQKIDNTFPFQTDPAKRYSLFIPASYDDANPNAVMVAFHPFNFPTWTALTWRDELTQFAADNDLILVCPDGGNDGRVDDQLDYDFTTALLDSVREWYNVDEDRIYAMGFSVGGKATYEYGLANASVFSGFIPIGAAINGTTGLDDNLSKALCKPFYLVHGENDAPGTRYTPIKDALEQNNAEVNFILMAGVGHTISFPNRNSILNAAFRWIDTVQCKTPTGIGTATLREKVEIYPTLVDKANGVLTIDLSSSNTENVLFRIWSTSGKLVQEGIAPMGVKRYQVNTGNLKSGTYLVEIATDNDAFVQKIVLH